jgi:hypothetical protein
MPVEASQANYWHTSFIFSWLPGASAIIAASSDKRCWHLKEIRYDGHDDALFDVPSHFWHHFQCQTWHLLLSTRVSTCQSTIVHTFLWHTDTFSVQHSWEPGGWLGWYAMPTICFKMMNNPSKRSTNWYQYITSEPQGTSTLCCQFSCKGKEESIIEPLHPPGGLFYRRIFWPTC